MAICSWIDQHEAILTRTSDAIWGMAELKFTEYRSSAQLQQLLQDHGFTITNPIGGMETAFIASWGQGQPVIGLLAEFDALSGLSQQADCCQPRPEAGMNCGHGCGHHLFGTASCAAAISVKNWLEQEGRRGTVRLYGCPGEEGGSGKTFMAKAGVFNDLDCAIAWHPMFFNAVQNVSTLANIQAYFRFHGRASHAAASPHLGRSALDAVELMDIGANYLREHMIPEARLHYAITNPGGLSPNVVQAEAEVLYLIRAPHADQLQEIYERVCQIAQGAALMTGTQSEVVFDKACSNILPNDTLGQVMYRHMQQLPPPAYTAQEEAYARSFTATLTPAEKGSAGMLSQAFGAKPELNAYLRRNRGKVLMDELLPYVYQTSPLPGSSDVGDVSWITPTIQCNTTCFAAGTPIHSWQEVAQGKSAVAHKGMIYAARIMALTAADIFMQPELAVRARQELRDLLNGREYVCPIPDGVKPHAYSNNQ
ncbi:amidohydrolase [Oscillospiraceae bacterium HV4-5-C5C]|nr:amidohydrolase [Oscillospiraceae bacterium HV4-5-C5C]